MFWGIRSWCFVIMLVLFLSTPLQAQIPIPAAIGGSVTVNGTALTQAKAEGFRFVVTRQDGSAYEPDAEYSGLNEYDWYRIKIPMYDASLQPGGAMPGDIAVIHVYKNETELKVISPVDGQFTLGDQGSTTRMDLLVASDRVIINPVLMLLLNTD